MFEFSDFLNRDKSIFYEDIYQYSSVLSDKVENASFLVIGGAGSIGQAVVKQIFRRNPKKLHVIDISENNLTELVRDIRSSFGYIQGEFKVFCLDIGSDIFNSFFDSQKTYDYVINLSALKHVRSEKDPFTLMRMIDVNIVNTYTSLHKAIEKGSRKYFSVSTDKAANPINLMGASKKIMELFLLNKSNEIEISSTRFANVAFSDGSLLYSFLNRFSKNQPLVAPNDIKRYFISPQESGELCLLSCLLGNNKELFFPKISKKLPEVSFKEMALLFIEKNGYKPIECQSEDEARLDALKLIKEGFWPCFFSPSDTTGEKDLEEFYTKKENVDFELYHSIGVIKQKDFSNSKLLLNFIENIKALKDSGNWTKKQLVVLFKEVLSDFDYHDKGKYLDSKM